MNDPADATDRPPHGRPENARLATLLALADQGVLALISFGMLLGYPYVLAPTGYAQFVLVHAVVLFAHASVGSLVSQPMLVLGGGHGDAERSRYLSRVLAALPLMCGVVGLLVIALTSLVLRDTPAPGVLWASGAVGAMFCGFDVMRRAAYLRAAHRAVLGATTALILFGVSIGVLLEVRAEFGLHEALWAWALAFAGGIGALALGIRQRRWTGSTAEGPEPESWSWQHLAAAHFGYGRWSLLGSWIYWLCTGGYFILLVEELPAADIVVLRTMLTLFAPSMILLAALENRLLPDVARRVAGAGARMPGSAGALSDIYRSPGALVVLVCAAYFMLVPLIHGSVFPAYVNPVLSTKAWSSFLAMHLALLIVWPVAVLSRALRKPERVFLAHLCGALLAYGNVIAEGMGPGLPLEFGFALYGLGYLLCTGALHRMSRSTDAWR